MPQYTRYPNNSSILKVPTFAALPATAADGDLAVTLDTDTIYIFNAGTMTWVPVAGGGGPITVSDTNSIDLTLAASNLSGVVRISSNAADANNLIVPIDVESTGVVGLRAQVAFSGIRGLVSGVSPILYNSSTGAVSIQQATTVQNGYLSSTDFNTFNNKQPAGNYITALTGDVVATGPGSVAATIQPLAVTGAKIANLTITDAQVSNTAAIAYAKLALANSIVNADINAAAAIAYSKLNLSNSVVNADINAAAAIAYSKLNLTTSIQNSDIALAASISMSKLQALTANRAVATDGTGHINTTAITDTEQGYLSGVTSAIQTQLNAKQNTATLTTKGDLYVRDATVVTRQPVGTDGFVLTADSTQSTGVKWVAPSTVTETIAKANTSAGQSINGPGMTVINYDNVLKDTASGITTGAGWTYTIPSDGDYQIAATLFSENISPGVGAIFTLEIWLNGSFVEFIDREVFMTASAVNLLCKGATILTDLNTGDTIQFQCTYSGASATILSTNPGGNYVSIYRIPGS